jgi:hypothetical protein
MAVVLLLGPSDILNTCYAGKQRLHNQCLSRSGLSNACISVPYCQIRRHLTVGAQAG